MNLYLPKPLSDIVAKYLDCSSYDTLIILDPINFTEEKLKKKLLAQVNTNDLLTFLRYYEKALLIVRKNFAEIENKIDLFWVIKLFDDCIDDDSVIYEIAVNYHG